MTQNYIRLIILIFILYGCTNNQSSSINSTFPTNPMHAEIITSDVDLFWETFDELLRDTIQNPFERYIKEGSPGLQNFISNQRIVGPDELKELVLSEKKYYSNIRSSSYKAVGFKNQIKASFYALKYLYPEAVFPPTYILIGRTTSGGTASDAGLSIGVEIFSDNQARTAYGRPSLDIELLPFLTAHEIIHFLQKDDQNNETLLKHCIREGSADFIAEMIAGEKVKYCNGPNVYEYGEQNFKKLFEEFKETMNKEELSPWLGSETIDGRPQNLGYWIGYKIVKSYFDLMDDKKKAIKDILNINNYQKFYEDSGIEDDFM
ncbi:gliding motility protein GldB-related protein [Aquimarina algiphila]|uniref:gliding motility protein GldB-related protein n=1 Tax=Aquimarina algiphila TaxID=2047982 RepID=UPI00232F6EBE|nr:DUF2268 domain-containing putative Zn-dependent protease [Aquimarina algiphila]